jgi:acylglycerol lipase
MITDADKAKHGSGEFEGAGGIRLHEQWWRPEGESRAAIAVVHGLYDYSDYYAPVAEQFVRSNYSVYAFDLRGHGRSEGDRSFVSAFDDYLADLDRFLGRTRDREKGKPVIILAHSMGGAIATLFVIKRQPELRGLLLSGAALKEGSDVSPLLKRVTPIIGSLFPKLPAAKLDLNAASRDREVVKRKQNDPLIDHKAIPARTGAEILKAIDQIQAQMETVTLPTLIMHGTADRWTNPEGSKQLYARARSTDKTLKLYDGFYHEILSDPEKARVLDDVFQWLNARASVGR